MLIVIVNVQLHLSQVGVRQLLYFQINEHVALQDRVIKHKVDIEMIAVERQALLPIYERKSSSEFKKELVEMIEQSLFEFRFY